MISSLYILKSSFNCGTIRAVASGTYMSGWTWNGAVAVNGETTLDPNGKTIVFTGAYDLSGFTSVTLNGRVTPDLGARVQKLDDGAYLAVSGFSLIFR